MATKEDSSDTEEENVTFSAKNFFLFLETQLIPAKQNLCR
jgi:hypothetical protein